MSVFSDNALKGKHALITGATGGIGYATAKVLVQMGAAVTITGRNENKLQALKEEIHNSYPDAQVFLHTADLTAEDQRNALVSASEKENGFISLLVNAAGISGGGPVDELKEKEMNQIMTLNYNAAVLLTQRVYKTMKEKGEGAVVNVSSLSGLRGTHSNTAYSASKFALIGFTHSMAVEAIEHGVRVNAICPGYVDTDMGRSAIEKKAQANGRTLKEQMDLVKDGLPSGRLSQPEEVANTIAFLLTDAAENIVGESVKISGGVVLR